MDTASTLPRSTFRLSDERTQRPGRLLLDRYRLRARLGAGGFGTVWCAHDEQLDREVALKRIPLPFEEDRERARREALVCARLAHPAIVALYEANADEDAFYLVSELVHGSTLAQLIAEDLLSDEQTLQIGVALCAALAHAHERGVIHRDVKPHNVLVPGEQTAGLDGHAGWIEHAGSLGRPSCPPPIAAKLADFGGAQISGEEALTRTGDVLGTLAYMAPEQCHGEYVGEAADLYSLALVLYEALSGVNPVRGRTPAATARRIGAPIEQLGRRRRDLPRPLTRALMRALDPDPETRGAIADLHEALAHALEHGRARGSRTRRAPATLLQPAVVEDRELGELDLPSVNAATRVHGLDAHGLSRPGARPPWEGHGEDAPREERPRARRTRTLALPRAVWVGGLLAIVVWQAAAGRPGVALLLAAAGAPFFVLPRRTGPGWLVAAIAPALGLVGLAGAFPALAGQRRDLRARAGLGALGFWWLTLAEPLIGRRLWLGPPEGLPARSVWESSPASAATHALAPALAPELLLGALVWAIAAAILPWLVRGHNAALDVIGALVWTTALLAAVPLLERVLLASASQATPRGALLGGGVGCALALAARALRGPA